MKSSMTHTSHRGMIINYVRYHPVSFVTGQVMTFENNYKQMKSSMTQALHTEMIIYHARFHVTL
ncbi:hypothetical protein U3A58_07070 [Algoriphagus sp. C2-6-M1]|uniref:hypothetical protein n=1 Tax=Algoriphagus persicinus TaxID=3108754 RepID=UPI002B3CC8EA|nr:hypothetical protein [Algoriphagus sp. C2-6-M1]MEB2780149.1 hypothetical protein [Algoriphagus sp. C2-6-M1]